MFVLGVGGQAWQRRHFVKFFYIVTYIYYATYSRTPGHCTGVAAQAFGLAIEAIADQQKSAHRYVLL